MASTIRSALGGFTLVEALVATALVATAAAALAQLVALGVTQSAATRDALQALVAAQAKLEDLRALTWSASAGGSGLVTSPPGTLVADTTGFVDRSDPFVLRWAIAERDASDPDVVVIHVCAFAARNAGQPEVCVSTMRTRRP